MPQMPKTLHGRRYNLAVTGISLVEAAQLYRKVGISVIPIAAGTKVPDGEALAATRSYVFPRRISWWLFTRRLPTDDEINTWFASGTRNLAIVSGYRQLLILDFDDAASYERWYAKYGSLADKTCIQKSPRGFHVLFRWKGTWTIPFYATSKFHLLDSRGLRVGELKGDRDWVVAWPSIHPSGIQYAWLPHQAPWDKEILRIDSLHQIGVEPFRDLVGGYVRILPRLLFRPRSEVPAVMRKLESKYRALRGVRGVIHKE